MKHAVKSLLLMMIILLLGAGCVCHAQETEQKLYVPGEGETVIEPILEVPDYVLKLLDVARDELGYTESKSGRTKYGEWSGDPTAQWCAEYLCWCVDQTDQKYGLNLLTKVYPKYSGTNVGRNWFIREGRYISRLGFIPDWGSQWYKGETTTIPANSYVPQPGDWVFFSILENGDTTHVAMVECCTLNADGKIYLHVLEGNMPDKVQRQTYALDDWRIQGYGTVYDLADWSMSFGNKGEKVRRIQEYLVKLGYLEERFVTGQYGDLTRNAVTAYQKDHGIEATGNCGPQTQRSLNAEIEKLIMNDLTIWQVAE